MYKTVSINKHTTPTNKIMSAISLFLNCVNKKCRCKYNKQ